MQMEDMRVKSSMPKSLVKIEDFVVDLPDDVLERDYDEKYLLLFDTKARKHIVLSRRAAYHSDVLAIFMEELKYRGEVRAKDDIEVCGGGILQIQDSGTAIKTFGKSGAFGAVQSSKLKIVKKCLETAFKEAKVDVASTNFVRD